jgi:hypothetical protein
MVGHRSVRGGAVGRAGTAAATVLLGLVAGVIAPGVPLGAAASTSSQFYAVSCQSGFCMAVGEHAISGGGSVTLAERWNGSAWSIVASPSPAGSKFSRLYAVSCTSPSSCFAAGTQFDATTSVSRTLVERWNGQKWSMVADAAPAGAFLFGIDCTSTTFCVAVGDRAVGDPVGYAVLVERWNGHSWSLGTTPKVANGRFLQLHGVDCTSTRNCAAIGYYLPSNGSAVPLAERWNGTKWSIVPSADTGPLGEGDLLKSVSCSSAAKCVAAGEYELGGAGRPATFIEQWDGKSWKVVPSSDPARSYSALQGVSCASATDCSAVGTYATPKGRFTYPTETLAERWNGTKWSIVPSPSPGANVSELAGVSCWGATHCFAVGAASASNQTTLTERWDGTKWAIVASPNPMP